MDETAEEPRGCCGEDLSPSRETDGPGRETETDVRGKIKPIRKGQSVYFVALAGLTRDGIESGRLDWMDFKSRSALFLPPIHYPRSENLNGLDLFNLSENLLLFSVLILRST